MNDNYKYLTVDDVKLALSRILPDNNVQQDDAVAWCFEALSMAGDVDSMGKFIDIPLTVTTNSTVKRAQLPPNIYRLIEVYSSKTNKQSRIKYQTNGKLLQLPTNYSKDIVYISYYGVLLDDEFNPLIPKKLEQACMWNLAYNSVFSDYLNGKLNESQMERISKNKMIAFESALSGYQDWTADDFRKMEIIMGNIIPKIGSYVLIHKRTGDGI